MTKLFACINTYGSAVSLRRTLESLVGQVDGAVVHSGPYAGWPRLGGSAADPVDAVPDLPFPYLYTRHGHLLQKTARTQALQLVATLKPTSDDWLLIIDDDEVFRCKADLRRVLSGWAADYASVDVEDLRFEKRFPQNRLVRWMPGLRYDPNHWTIRSPLGIVTQNASAPFYLVDRQAEIVNDPSLRSSRWKHERSLYRMLQFIGNEGTWSASKYFEGSDCEASFVDPEGLLSDAESVKRSAASGNEFDMGLLLMLSQVASGSEQEIVQWSDRTKGMVTGLLYAAGMIPWPYAKKKTGGSVPP